MKLTRLVFLMATLALAIASAASAVKMKLDKPAFFGDTQLKPGEYKVEVDGDKAVIKLGKNSIETAVKTQTENRKFNSTQVGFDESDHIIMIGVGGTTTTLLLGKPVAEASSAK